MAARLRDSAMVEQAPYSPKKGTPALRAAYPALMHWLSRSPAKRKSSTDVVCLAFSKAAASARFCISTSAFSQLRSPKEASGEITSKLSFSGPSPSFGPTTLACPAMEGGLHRAKVCFPIFLLAIRSLPLLSCL